MDSPLILEDNQVRDLQWEVIPTHARVYLVQLIRRGGDPEHTIHWQNRFINRARSIHGLYPCVLSSDAQDEYLLSEHTWHDAELDASVRRLTASEFIEYLGVIVEEGWFGLEKANHVLMRANSSVRLDWQGSMQSRIGVNLLDQDELQAASEADNAPNVRTLMGRMQRSLEEEDYSAVLHASASIFETLAKELVGSPSVANQPLGGFFDAYRNKSALPAPVLDYIKAIYNKRNTEPLAGHGAVAEPTFSKSDAEMLVPLTRAFVQYERRMAQAPE